MKALTADEKRQAREVSERLKAFGVTPADLRQGREIARVHATMARYGLLNSATVALTGRVAAQAHLHIRAADALAARGESRDGDGVSLRRAGGVW